MRTLLRAAAAALLVFSSIGSTAPPKDGARRSFIVVAHVRPSCDLDLPFVVPFPELQSRQASDVHATAPVSLECSERTPSVRFTDSTAGPAATSFTLHGPDGASIPYTICFGHGGTCAVKAGNGNGWFPLDDERHPTLLLTIPHPSGGAVFRPGDYADVVTVTLSF